MEYIWRSELSSWLSKYGNKYLAYSIKLKCLREYCALWSSNS